MGTEQTHRLLACGDVACEPAASAGHYCSGPPLGASLLALCALLRGVGSLGSACCCAASGCLSPAGLPAVWELRGSVCHCARRGLLGGSIALLRLLLAGNVFSTL